MLQPLRQNRARRQISRVHTIPAPVGGLNARDPLYDMPPQDAVTLKNFFPEANYVALRRGHASHGTGMTTAVQTLMTYHAANGSEKLFAAANAAIWDVTTAGAASSSYSTSITSNKWQHINFSTTAQLHILAFNGADTPLKYDGSSWGTNTITASGLTSTNLISAFSHKEHVWMTEKDTLNLWYLPSGAISGTAVKFPLTGVFNLGGQIMAGGTLSVSDSGEGIDDLLVAVTDNGEVALYTGTDPATDFALVGVYRIGEPIGRRCLVRLGGDLIVITTDGAVSLQTSLNFDRSKMDQVAITAKINELFNSAARSYGSNFGWQGIVYPKARQAIFNVPVAEGSRQTQYVMNTITGAWCEFANLNAGCWGILNGELYFGGNAGVVYKADTGYQDAGGQISAEMKTAFNHCGTPQNSKFFNMLRPMLVTGGAPELLVGVNTDFSDNPPTGTLTASAGNTALWGTALWGTSEWGGSLVVRDWLTVGGIGNTVAARLKVASNNVPVQVNGFMLNHEVGGVL